MPEQPRSIECDRNTPLAGDRFKGRTVLLIIVGHLSSAPRAQKEARALRAAGANVVVRGNWSHPGLAEEDAQLAHELDIDFAPVTDLRREGGNLGDRLRHRAAQALFQRLGRMTPRVLGPGAPELLRTARRMRADLTMVHSEPGLWVGQQLLADGLRVGVDFEDWFSADQLPGDRPERVRRTLQNLERDMLQRAHCCLATTSAMAQALATDAGSSRLPAVVRNCFPVVPVDTSVELENERAGNAVSFYWFSQTIGPARGLETLAEALALLHGDWQLNLRGSILGHSQWFERTFPASVRARVRCLPPAPNRELYTRTQVHDVGLALELPYCPNKDLTASNKIHEYLRGGLAVIATRTRGQQEVMDSSLAAGTLVEPGNPVALAHAMQTMIDDPGHRQRCREQAAHAGRHVWDWDLHEPVLLHALAEALA